MTELTELALIWASTAVAVFAAKATRLTPVVYYLRVGAELVNVGLIPDEHSEFIRGLSEMLTCFFLNIAVPLDSLVEAVLRSLARVPSGHWTPSPQLTR